MKKISALSKRPGEPPRHVWVSNNLEALQKAVDEYDELKKEHGDTYAEEKLRQRAEQVSGIKVLYQHEAERAAYSAKKLEKEDPVDA